MMNPAKKPWAAEFAAGLPADIPGAISSTLDGLLALYQPHDLDVKAMLADKPAVAAALYPWVVPRLGRKPIKHVPPVVVHSLIYSLAEVAAVLPASGPSLWLWRMLGWGCVQHRVLDRLQAMHDYFLCGQGGFTPPFGDNRQTEVVLGYGDLVARLKRFQPEWLAGLVTHDLIRGQCDCFNYVLPQNRVTTKNRCRWQHFLKQIDPSWLWHGIDTAAIGFSHGQFALDLDAAGRRPVTFLNGRFSGSMAGHWLREGLTTGNLMRRLCPTCGQEDKGECVVTGCPLKSSVQRTLLAAHREWIVCQPYHKCHFCDHVTFAAKPPKVCPSCHHKAAWNESFDHFAEIKVYVCDLCTVLTAPPHFPPSKEATWRKRPSKELKRQSERFAEFAESLYNQENMVSKFVWGKLAETQQTALNGFGHLDWKEQEQVMNAVWEVLNGLIDGGALLDPALWAGVKVSRMTNLAGVLLLKSAHAVLQKSDGQAVPIPEPLAATIKEACADVPGDVAPWPQMNLAAIHQLLPHQSVLGKDFAGAIVRLSRYFLQDAFSLVCSGKTYALFPEVPVQNRYFKAESDSLKDEPTMPSCPICHTMVRKGSRRTTGLVTVPPLPDGEGTPTHAGVRMTDPAEGGAETGENYQTLADRRDAQREATIDKLRDGTEEDVTSEATDIDPAARTPAQRLEDEDIQEAAEEEANQGEQDELEDEDGELPEGELDSDEAPELDEVAPSDLGEHRCVGPEPVPKRPPVSPREKALAELAALLQTAAKIFRAIDWRSSFCSFLAKHAELATRLLGPQAGRSDALYRETWTFWKSDPNFPVRDKDKPKDWSDLKDHWEDGLRQEVWEHCQSLAAATRIPKVLEQMATSADCFRDWRSQAAKVLSELNPAVAVDCLKMNYALPGSGKRDSSRHDGALTLLHKALRKHPATMGTPPNHEEFRQAWLGVEGEEFAAVFRLLYRPEGLVTGLMATGDEFEDWRRSLCHVLAEDLAWALKYLLAWDVLPIELRVIPLLAETDMEVLRKRLPEEDRANLPSSPGALRELLTATSAAMDPLIQALKINLAGLTPLRTNRGE